MSGPATKLAYKISPKGLLLYVGLGDWARIFRFEPPNKKCLLEALDFRGLGDWARTSDLALPKRVRYQLRYTQDFLIIA